MKKKYGLTIAERLIRNSKTDLTTGCIEWKLAIHHTGYANIKINGAQLRAHRVSYTIFNGPIPNNINVCHTCDNKKCINPAHLFLGTQLDNMKDMVLKGRYKKGKIYNALTRKEKSYILSNYKTSKQKDIAKHLNRSQTTISAYLKRNNINPGKGNRQCYSK